MITEDYVSFEIAKLLKEKGFDAECRAAYTNYGKLFTTQIQQYITNALCSRGYLWDCIAPTLQMVMKWLRIEHNIHIEPHIVKTKRSYGYMSNYIDLKELKQKFPFDEFDFSDADKYVCITYDKACEVAIKYYLEHLI